MRPRQLVGRPRGPRGRLQAGCGRRIRGPGFSLREGLADAQDRAQIVLAAADELAADDRVGLTLISTALGVTDDGPRREARDHGRRDLTGVGATGLRVDVLGADRHAAAGQGCRDHRQADGGRADDSDDGRLVHGRGQVDRQLPGIGRDRVHLPVAGDDDRAHGRIIACGLPPTRGAPTPAARSSDSGRARPRGR